MAPVKVDAAALEQYLSAGTRREDPRGSLSKHCGVDQD